MSDSRIDEEATESLISRASVLSNGDPDGESEALWEVIRDLHRRPEESVFRAASGWCSSRAPLERRLGADVLGQLGHPEEDADEDEEEAVSPLAERSLPVLQSLLRDEDARVLHSAVVALGHLASHGVEWDGALLEPLAAHADPEVREAVAFALGGAACDRSEAAVGIQLRLMGDADEEVRSWAAFGLAVSDVDSAKIRAGFVAGLADSVDHVRVEAMFGLARRGDERAVQAVLAELASDDVPQRAIDAAAELPRAEFLPHLEALLEANPDDESIQQAVDACDEVA